MKPLEIINSKPKLTEIPVYERKDFNYIIAGGFVLAACAGFVNICSILQTSITVSHNTGIFTKMGHDFAKIDLPAAIFKMFILIGYLFGSATVGFFLQKDKFKLSRKYGLFFITEAILLFITIKLYQLNESTWSVIISSYAMGLQNALFTNFSGAVVRTTHVTGLLTDVGLILGHYLRGKEKNLDLWRLKVLLPLMCGFFIGAFSGTLLFNCMGVLAMYFPVLILGVSGSIWTALRLTSQLNTTPRYNSNYEKL